MILKKLTILTLYIFSYSNIFGQEVKWGKVGEKTYDITYEVAKKSFVIKKLNDTTHTVQVNKLRNSEEFPYSQQFLSDSTVIPNGRLIVTEKFGSEYATFNYLNGKLIGTNTYYYKKNKRISVTYFDSLHVQQADTSWDENGKISQLYNRKMGTYYRYHKNGEVECSANLEKSTGKIMIQIFNEKGVLTKSEKRNNNEKGFWPNY